MHTLSPLTPASPLTAVRDFMKEHEVDCYTVKNGEVTIDLEPDIPDSKKPWLDKSDGIAFKLDRDWFNQGFSSRCKLTIFVGEREWGSHS